MMITQPARGRAAAIAFCGVAAIAIAACATAKPDPAAGQQSMAVTTTAAGVPAVADCARHAQTRPGQYTLACGNGGAYLTGLHWAAWGSSAAFGDGTNTFNDCQPGCVAGHGHSFPALVALWRPEPLPGHPGKRYLTRLTIIYTGNRTYGADGGAHTLPVTVTDPPSPFGGA